MKITYVYEIGDKILFKAPAGPMKFVEVVGIIDDITQHMDEENDLSSTVFSVNVNETLYNISHAQIVGIKTDEDHECTFDAICTACGLVGIGPFGFLHRD